MNDNVCYHSLTSERMALTELQFEILDGMADDYEDVEQLYLYANRNFDEERRREVQLPLMLIGSRFPLREIIDEITILLHEGYIEAKYSNDEKAAPLDPLDKTAIHHYWFGATVRGREAWKEHAAARNLR